MSCYNITFSLEAGMAWGYVPQVTGEGAAKTAGTVML